ncbi:MAG: hypothetical protein ACSLFH_01425 [Desulfuromonadales bacterium]
MSSKHYDIAIIGGSLSARIAAALFAKQGSKVLFLRHREATASTWFHSSLFLEKLLGTLGGRSCFMAQKPIQVFSPKVRVTLNNDIPLDGEFRREFGQDGAAVTQWLETLRVQGVQLEELFWKNGGLPWPSCKAKVHFKLLCMSRNINWAQFDAPVTKSLGQLSSTARLFVTDLLQGLSLMSINRLSRAQSALLWTQARRPENIRGADFSNLLSKRFEQFHGLKAELADLECIDFNGFRWTGGKLRDAGQFTAKAFLLGDARWVDRFKPGKPAALPLAHSPAKQITSPLTGQLSPLLASRVICGGGMPLRLAIEEDETGLSGQFHYTGAATEQQLRQLLEPVLPFVDYALPGDEENISPHIKTDSANRQQQLARLPLQIGNNLYCADSSILMPELEASGAALLGWTLANHLTSMRKRGQA